MATYNRSDLDSTIINGRLTGLYYYYVNSNEVYKATYLGFCPNIINVAYNPFLAILPILPKGLLIAPIALLIIFA